MLGSSLSDLKISIHVSLRRGLLVGVVARKSGKAESYGLALRTPGARHDDGGCLVSGVSGLVFIAVAAPNRLEG